MSDAASDWLINTIRHENAEKALWCSDENIQGSLTASKNWQTKPILMSNRWDVAQRAEEQGFIAYFSDFNFSVFEDESFSHVFYRISKEKPVTHHIINAAYRLLTPGGKFFISGQKNEGIKTYIDKAALLFASPTSAQKNGLIYTATLKKMSQHSTNFLDDSHYHQLRPIASLDSITPYSKPGLFGWNKIDQGSEFLIRELPAFLNTLPARPTGLLDLGCGYGYLTLMTATLDVTQRVLTDNNAAALTTASYNCERHGLNVQVIAADCGDQVQGTFDLILCNPPFHQGFAVDGDLTNKFIRGTKRLLAKNGSAVFVVNQFIPLERKASEYFRKVQLLADNGSFKVVALSH